MAKTKTKMKTKKTLLKKIKVTGSGKIMRSHQLRSGHLRRNKSKAALRRHATPVVLSKTIEKSIKRMLARA